MSTLVWAVKSSLLEYTRSMQDGQIVLADGATETTGGFWFPGADTVNGVLRFRGSVTLTGHGGMMRIVISDPWLHLHGPGALLSIKDDDEPGGRLRFAQILELKGDGTTLRAVGTALTADGADLFFGPYAEGTSLGDPTVMADDLREI